MDEIAHESRARRLASSIARIVREVSPYFLLGMLVAAVLTIAVPEDALPGVLGGSSGLAAFALAAVVGIPLYVCEGEEVPLTYGLLATGLGSGPAFTFLMGSVGTCVPTVLMSRGIIGKRATYFYLGFWILFAIAAGAVYGLLPLKRYPERPAVAFTHKRKRPGPSEHSSEQSERISRALRTPQSGD